METTRLGAFADGVFAIAATLLILDVEVPHAGRHSLAHELVRLWPAYAGYAVSFATMGIIWIAGGRLLRQDADRREFDRITRSYRPGVPMYAAATLVGIFQAQVSAALFAAIALLYVLSSSFFGPEEAVT